MVRKRPIVQQGPLSIFEPVKIPGEMAIRLQIKKAYAVQHGVPS